jgi:hypothetical protein
MDKKFLDKVVYQIMRETEMVYPTSDELGYVNFPFSRIYAIHDSLIKKNWTIRELGGYFSLSPSSSFIRHLKEIYGITQKDVYNYESDSEVFYLWDKYIEVFIDKLKRGINIVDVYDPNIPNRWVGQLDESKEINLRDSKFLQKILKYLIDNTKVGRYEKLPDIDFHYEGYIIVPIGNGFRFDVYNKSVQGDGYFVKEWWREMKEVYSLKNEEVIPLLDEYNNYLWGLVNKISSKEDINESKSSNNEFLDKLLYHIKSETKFKDKYTQLPFFPEDWYKELNKMYITDFSWWMSTTFGVEEPTEIEYMWERYSEWVNETIENGGRVNESEDRKIKYKLSKEETKKLLSHFTLDMGYDKESAIEGLNHLVKWFNELPNNVKLYRLLYLDDESDIDYNELGYHYSNNKRELVNNHYNRGSIYGDMGEYPYLVTVESPKYEIDFLETITNNILFPNEQEITLKNKGRGVKFINVTKL